MGNLQQTIRLHKIVKAKYHAERQQLDLRSVGAEDSIIILTSHEWMQIRILVISDNKINDNHIDRILQSPFPNVIQLNLYTNCITDIGLATILDKLGPKLMNLLLQHNNVTEEGFFLILEKNLNLQRLDLRSNLINLRTAYNTSNLNRLEHEIQTLKYINLNSNVIGPNGCCLINKMKLYSLEHLEIAGCVIGNEGLIHLSKSNLESIQKIDLNNNYIGLKGLCHFIQLSEFKKLKYLHLNSNILTYSDMFQVLVFRSRELNYATTLNSLIYDHYKMFGQDHFVRIEKIMKSKFR